MQRVDSLANIFLPLPWSGVGGVGVGCGRKAPAAHPGKGRQGSQSYSNCSPGRAQACSEDKGGRRKSRLRGLTLEGVQPSKLSKQCKEYEHRWAGRWKHGQGQRPLGSPEARGQQHSGVQRARPPGPGDEDQGLPVASSCADSSLGILSGWALGAGRRNSRQKPKCLRTAGLW